MNRVTAPIPVGGTGSPEKLTGTSTLFPAVACTNPIVAFAVAVAGVIVALVYATCTVPITPPVFVLKTHPLPKLTFAVPIPLYLNFNFRKGGWS